MADAVLIEVADAIAAELKAASDAGTFIRTFEPDVLWADRNILLEDLDVLHVSVAPMGFARSLKTRGSWKTLCTFHIGIRKRFTGDEQSAAGTAADSEVKDLVTLTEQLVEFFMPVRPDHQGRKLTTVTDAAWSPERTGETEPVFNWMHLQRLQFTSFFPLSYEVTRVSA